MSKPKAAQGDPTPLILPNEKFIPLFAPTRAPTLINGQLALIADDHKTVICPNGTPVPPSLIADPGHSRTRYYVYYGGRGGAKSHQSAIAATQRSMAEKITILCCRGGQSSMAGSVHKLINHKIVALGAE